MIVGLGLLGGALLFTYYIIIGFVALIVYPLTAILYLAGLGSAIGGFRMVQTNW